MTEVVETKAALPADKAKIDEIAYAGEQYQEHLTKDDVTLPFLQLLQSQSPQCTKGQADFIKGAKASDICDVSAGRIWKTHDDDDNEVQELRVMPVVFKSCYTEWVPRSQGGGFVKEWSVPDGDSIIISRNEAGQDIIQPSSPLGTAGNQLNRTHTHFIYVIEKDRHWPAVISMQVTQLKPSRDWNRLIQECVLPDGRKSPRFFAFWNVSAALRTNDKGSWFLWKFTKSGDVLSEDRMEVFQAAKSFVESNSHDEVQVNYADVAKTEGANVDEDEAVEQSTASTSQVSDDEIPF